MIDKPDVAQSTAQLTAVIHLTIPRNEIGTAMGHGIKELLTTIAAQGLTPDGPIFSHHFKMDPETFDFEIGVPVTKPISPAGRVRPGHLPATTLARTVYHGPYEGLGNAWREFGSWIDANSHIPAPDRWECYVTGPESDPDPSKWRTELNRPLIHVMNT